MAHIITAVIGSGVLSLAWSTSQLGWIGGPVSLLCFAIITYLSAFLLSDCYRSPDSVTGKRNHSYMDAVRVNLGSKTADHLYYSVVFNIGIVSHSVGVLLVSALISLVIVQVGSRHGVVVCFNI